MIAPLITPEEIGARAVASIFIGPRAHNVEIHATRSEINAIARAAVRYDRQFNGRAELLTALRAVLAQYDRPHGFDSTHWYGAVMESARAILARFEP